MPVVGRAAVVVGFLLLAAVGALIAVSGLIMPVWAVVVLAIVWAIAVGVAIKWRRKPALVLMIPIAMVAVCLLTAWAGEAFLDWTA